MSRPTYTFPEGRTVPAEQAIKPPSSTVRCACGVLYQPRAGATSCLTCERGADPKLGKLIVPRHSPSVAVFGRKAGAR